MPSKLPLKRVLPTLLDRLTDNTIEKGNVKNELIAQTYDTKQLRMSVERDLQWLFETVAMSADSTIDIASFPHVPSSVLNYGVPDIIGAIARSINEHELEKALTVAIQRFEPRIIKESLEVNINIGTSKTDKLDELFEIQLTGLLWAEPRNLPFTLKKQVTMVSSNKNTGAIQ